MRPSISIIGCGKLGRSLGRLWSQSGTAHLTDVLNRTPTSAEGAVAFIGAGRAAASFESLKKSKVFLIGTPDGGIAPTCARLAATGLLDETTIVFHCSGALDSSCLQAARERGAAVASIHPIKSFAMPEAVVEQFGGTFCGVEGDLRALDVLLPLFQSIGAVTVPIDGERKVLYHSAAVVASNYLVTLLDTARTLYVDAGIDPDSALAMLAPLTRGTLENVLRAGPEAALTGPIARGDMETVARQQAALDALSPEIGELYRHFAHLTAELARRRK
ncbi:MAG TPA: Rossmann-like and DUF2520 domain-containing protein [Burkholderiaceae bacterium]